MAYTAAQSFKPTCTKELWNAHEQTGENTARINTHAEGFRNARQSSITHIHSSTWKLLLLLKEEILAKKEEVQGQMRR